MSDEPSIDPQPGDIGDGIVEIRGATEITGRRGVRHVPGTPDEPAPHGEAGHHGTPVPDLGGHRTEPLDPAAHLGSGGGSTTSDPGRVHPIIPGPPDLATSPPDAAAPPDLATTPAEPVIPPASATTGADAGAAQEAFLAQAPAPLPPVATPPAGSGSGRARGRAAAAAALLGAGASVLAAIRRRRSQASASQATLPAAPAPAAVQAPTPTPAPAAPPVESGPPADVEISLTAGVTTDDDPTTLSADASRHLELPQERASEEAARKAAAEPPEGASNVSLTAGVVPPDRPADERR